MMQQQHFDSKTSTQIQMCDNLPALQVCSLTEPVKNSVLCEDILVIERPHNFRKQFHQLCILIALHLDLVHEFQFQLPRSTEGIQQFCPGFDLNNSLHLLDLSQEIISLQQKAQWFMTEVISINNVLYLERVSTYNDKRKLLDNIRS